MSALSSPNSQRQMGSLPTTSSASPARAQTLLHLDEIINPALLATFETVFKPASLPDPLSSLSLKSYIRHITTSFSRLGERFITVCPDSYKTRRGSWYLASVVALQRHISAESHHFSLETTVAHLKTQGLLEPSHAALGEDARDTPPTGTRRLHYFYVFCLVGISAHLFQPSSTGNHHMRDIFVIEDCVPGSTHRLWSILSNKIIIRDPWTPVNMLIRGLGELSPVMDGDQRIYQAKTPTLRADQFNAHLFCSLLKMNIVWTDILNTHLDYDAETNTLFLFRHATFCALNSTASQVDDGNNANIWASCVDVDGPENTAAESDQHHPGDLLCEILLSLYMIFGQEATARRYFSTDKAFQGWPRSDHDQLLAIICRGQWPFQSSTATLMTCEPKPIYYLGRDFPMMQAKIDFLVDVVANKQPKSLAELWKDKRNTAQWYTFWAVIFYGTLGLLVSLAQLATSIIALYK